ncbi:hypothetical protein OsI_13547 [Oryza sativa Indica Group]|uniref:Uncharacterized protein n=1 Tax=Oryza sativa subsp. indica TaxID=39946 RepID=B8AJY7_ORYSI|nr:hypothetical protein OsI_13547 [Oryza sativa Indica Group]
MAGGWFDRARSVIEVKLGKLKCINDDCAYIPKLQLRALAHCHGSSQQTVCHQVVDDWLLHPETLAKVHGGLRKLLTTNVRIHMNHLCRSCTASNCKELAVQPDLNGFLVSGASLKHGDVLPKIFTLLTSALKNA